MDKTRVLSAKDSTEMAPKKSSKVEGDKGSEKTVVQVSSSRTVVQQPSMALSAKKGQPRKVGVGDCIKSRFELVDILGMGGMGIVYRARDLRRKELGDSEPYLALKILNEQLQHNDAALITLQQECRKSQRLAHPNIVNVHDFDRDRDVAFMTMELLYGQPLDEMIYAPDFTGEDLGTIAPYLKQIARALQYAHDNDIVHSDFKPGNVFIQDSGRVKIFDFGIARAVQNLDSSQDNLKRLAALTPAYASLGMLTDQAPAPADDLYAFAIVIYFWLTGRHPYRRKTAQEVAEQGLLPSRPAGLSEEAWKTLRVALSPAGVQSMTVAEFIAGLLPSPERLGPRAKQVIAGFVVMALTLAGGWGYRSWQDYQYAQFLASNEPAVIQQTLEILSELPAERAAAIVSSERDTLIDHALGAARNLQRQQRRHEALQYLQRFLDLMPDSQKLFQHHAQLLADIDEKQQQIVTELMTLESRILRLTVDESRQWVGLVQLLALTQPDHSLLQAARLADQLKVLVHSQLFMGYQAAVHDLLNCDYLLQQVPDTINELQALASGYAQHTRSLEAGVAGSPGNWHQLLTEEQFALLQSPEKFNPSELKGLLHTLSAHDREFVEAYRWAMMSQLPKDWIDSKNNADKWLESLSGE